jgi:hypothetical protein
MFTLQPELQRAVILPAFRTGVSSPPNYASWNGLVSDDAKVSTALSNRLIHQCHIGGTGNVPYRMQHST